MTERSAGFSKLVKTKTPVVSTIAKLTLPHLKREQGVNLTSFRNVLTVQRSLVSFEPAWKVETTVSM